MGAQRSHKVFKLHQCNFTRVLQMQPHSTPCPAPIQLLSGPTTPHIATAGTPHSFTCDFHSFPHSNITWEGVPLISGGRFEVHETLVHKEGVEFVRSVLRVNPVAEYDGGMMACVASNGVDQLRHSFQFQVFGEYLLFESSCDDPYQIVVLWVVRYQEFTH